MELMYKAFVRSTIEYGSLEYMSAGSSYKEKLERIQAVAERMGGFEVESLDSRREASLIGFIFKLLDGEGRGMLNDFIPTLTGKKTGLQIEPSLDVRATTKHYNRNIEGQFAKVWSKLPNELVNVGGVGEW